MNLAGQPSTIDHFGPRAAEESSAPCTPSVLDAAH